MGCGRLHELLWNAWCSMWFSCLWEEFLHSPCLSIFYAEMRIWPVHSLTLFIQKLSLKTTGWNSPMWVLSEQKSTAEYDEMIILSYFSPHKSFDRAVWWICWIMKSFSYSLPPQRPLFNVLLRLCQPYRNRKLIWFFLETVSNPILRFKITEKKQSGRSWALLIYKRNVEWNMGGYQEKEDLSSIYI